MTYMIPMKRNMKGLAGMPYPGSKSIRSVSPVGRWITSILPYREWYVEPFAGMLGVLLQRQPSKIELVSDVNADLINWWYTIRERPEDLIRMLNFTPLWSRELWYDAVEKLKTETDYLHRAYYWTLMMSWSYASTGRTIKEFYKHHSKKPPRIESRLMELSERIKDVQLESTDAVHIVRNVAKRKDAVIYLDPPYDVAAKKITYFDVDFNKDALSEALQECQGLVAVSGYGTEWDHLDWNRNTLETQEFISQHRGKRTEVLWCNWDLQDVLW